MRNKRAKPKKTTVRVSAVDGLQWRASHKNVFLNGLYRHYKEGSLWFVKDLAKDIHTGNFVVICQTISINRPQVLAVPYAEFVEFHENEKKETIERFVFLGQIVN